MFKPEIVKASQIAEKYYPFNIEIHSKISSMDAWRIEASNMMLSNSESKIVEALMDELNKGNKILDPVVGYTDEEYGSYIANGNHRMVAGLLMDAEIPICYTGDEESSLRQEGFLSVSLRTEITLHDEVNIMETQIDDKVLSIIRPTILSNGQWLSFGGMFGSGNKIEVDWEQLDVDISLADKEIASNLMLLPEVKKVKTETIIDNWLV